MNYNELSQQAHDNAVSKGFWEKELSEAHWLALVVSEICEAIEADRKGKYADVLAYINKTPDVSFDNLNESGTVTEAGIQLRFESMIKDTVPDELADAMIRLLDYAGHLQIDFTRLPPCKYYRVFRRFTFTENAFGLIKGLTKEYICIEKRIQFALDYLQAWSGWLGVDIEFHVTEKMKYNQGREELHGKKY